MKMQENHGFTTFDVLTLVFSLLAVLVVSGPIIKRSFTLDKVDIAHRDMEFLSKSLVSPDRVSYLQHQVSSPGTRAISSAPSEEQPQLKGDIGLDPWGRPYHYEFKMDVQGQPSEVVLWSDGPSHQAGLKHVMPLK